MEIEQGSPEWFAARLGKTTASNFNAIIARGAKGAFLAGRKNYRAQLVIERAYPFEMVAVDELGASDRGDSGFGSTGK